MAKYPWDSKTVDMFGGEEVPPAAPLNPMRPARRAGELTWHITDHACRNCMGRVLARISRGQILEVRCAECGEAAEGTHEAICCCGVQAGSHGSVLVCVPNPDITKASPQEILVRERRQRNVPVAVERRKPRPVGGGSDFS